jgi:hypothetical protein
VASTIIINAAAAAVAATTVDRPKFTATARVKQHFHQVTGELVQLEEHLLKIIVKWNPIPEAEAYELCHNCHFIVEETGEEKGGKNWNEDGSIIPIPIDGKHTCGAKPCYVMPAAPKGNNKFHLRVKKNGEFSLWSNYQNFNVQEPGNFEHEEL